LPHRRATFMLHGLLIDRDLGPAAVAAVALKPRCEVVTASSIDRGLTAVDPVSVDFLIADSQDLDRDLLISLWSRYPQCRMVVLRDARVVGITGVFARLGAFFPHAVAHLRLRRHGSAALASIGRRCFERVSLDTTGRELGISPDHLAHIFSVEVGQAFKQFVIRVRVEAAKRLLRETDETLEVIGERVGFYDAAHFSRLFSHVAGIGPGAFRQAIGKPRRGLANTG
jgi:AraC-like DNA-binding protein